MNGKVVDSLEMGGTAFVCGEVCQGDEILRIDEVDVSTKTASDQLTGTDIAGTIVTIVLQRSSRNVRPDLFVL